MYHMLRFAACWTAGICLMLLSACQINAPPEMDAAVRAAFAQLKAGDIPALKAGATDAITTVEDEVFANIRALIPDGEPSETRLIGYSFFQAGLSGQDESQHSLTYEYAWPDKIMLANAVLYVRASGAPLQLHGLNVRVATREELSANDFALIGKSPLHYIMLLGAVVTPLLMIVALVFAIRTPGLKRRWLWCIGSIVSVGSFGLNWATGQFGFNLLNVAVLGFGIARGGSAFDAWVVSFAFPLGAIIVIAMTWKRRAAAKTAGENAA